MTFDQLLTDVLAMAATRGVTTEIGENYVIVREADEWIADLRFELSGERVSVREATDDRLSSASWGAPELFDTVAEAADYFNIGAYFDIG